MSMRAGIAADAAAALLFRILSQPALLFPPLRQVEGIEVQHEYISSYSKQVSFLAYLYWFLGFLCIHQRIITLTNSMPKKILFPKNKKLLLNKVTISNIIFCR